MKKVISTKIYKTECENCGCLFEYDKTEIITGALKDPFTMDDLHYVECPRCKNLTKHKPIEQEEPTTAKEAFNLIKDKNAVMYIAKMQQQIDQFDNLFLHLHQRIHQNCTCENVIISDISRYKTTINEIIRIIDEHAHAHEKERTLEDIVAPAFKNDKAGLEDYCSKMKEAAKKLGIDPLHCSVKDAIKICDEFDKTKAGNQTTVFDIYPQIKKSNAINIVVTTPIDDFTTDPEAELNKDDIDDFAKILAKNRKCGYVTMFPTNKDSMFRKTFIEPNLNEKGFLRQDRFATELTTENGVKYMLFFPWCKADNQNAPYNEK